MKKEAHVQREASGGFGGVSSPLRFCSPALGGERGQLGRPVWKPKGAEGGKGRGTASAGGRAGGPLKLQAGTGCESGRRLLAKPARRGAEKRGAFPFSRPVGSGIRSEDGRASPKRPAERGSASFALPRLKGPRVWGGGGVDLTKEPGLETGADPEIAFDGQSPLAFPLWNKGGP